MTDQHDPDPFTAGVRLQAAIDQLTQPTVVDLDRDPLPGTDAWQQQRDDQDLLADHWASLRQAATVEDLPAVTADLDVIRGVHRRQAARQTPTVTVPALLDQLQDAVHGSNNTDHGAPSAGSARSPLALAALDLLTEINNVAGIRTSPHPHRTEISSDILRAWCQQVCNDETQVVQAAVAAADWPDRIRTLLDPPKRWTAPGACPDCGKTTAYVEQDGETVRRPTLEFDPAAGTARCLRCPARWEGEAQLRQLNKALTEDGD